MQKKVGRNKIIVGAWRLEPYSGLKKYDFDCGDNDLNDFFHEDVQKHDENLVAKTFILSLVGVRLSKLNPPLGFISFSNDTIRKESFETPSQWKKATKGIPHQKRYDVLPAVKIVRLGANKCYPVRHRIGTQMLNMTRELFLTENRTGCRFLTVDSYISEQAIEFYKKNGFDFFSPKEKTRVERLLDEQKKKSNPFPDHVMENADEKSDVHPQTVAMWFDLIRVG